MWQTEENLGTDIYHPSMDDCGKWEPPPDGQTEEPHLYAGTVCPICLKAVFLLGINRPTSYIQICIPHNYQQPAPSAAVSADTSV